MKIRCRIMSPLALSLLLQFMPTSWAWAADMGISPQIVSVLVAYPCLLMALFAIVGFSLCEAASVPSAHRHQAHIRSLGCFAIAILCNYLAAHTAPQILPSLLYASLGLLVVSSATAGRTGTWGTWVFCALFVVYLLPYFSTASWLRDIRFVGAPHVLMLLAGCCAALVGAWMSGKRRGVAPASTHISATGCLMIWIGLIAATTSAQLLGNEQTAGAASVYPILLHSLLASTAGFLAIAAASQLLHGHVAPRLAWGGLLAGAVAVSVNPVAITILQATAIGAIAGFSTLYISSLVAAMKADDTSGHAAPFLAGIISGLMALAITQPHMATLKAQFMGITATALIALAGSLVAWSLIHLITGLRLSEEEEELGLQPARSA